MHFLILVLLIVTIGCNDKGPVAVEPTSELNFSLPEMSEEGAATMRRVFTEGPAPFTVIECENTYLQGTEIPSVPEPSMWVNVKGQMEVVSSAAHPEWAETSWSPEFVNEDGKQVVCINAKQSEARTGRAWAMFVYPRGLIRGEDWPRPRGAEFGSFSPWEQREMAAMFKAPMTQASLLRFLELNPGTDHETVDDNGWSAALHWVESSRNDDLKYEVLRRYQPMGLCGNDRTPRDAYEKYISFCHDTKRVECILADYGVVNGSDYPDPRSTQLEKLPDDVDPIVYGVGAILRFPGSAGSHVFLNLPWKPVNAEPYVRQMEDLAADPNTDPYNRHLIARAIAAWDGAGRLTKKGWVPAATAAEIELPNGVVYDRTRGRSTHIVF